MLDSIKAKVGGRPSTKPFDINGDGQVDIKDLKAIFTGERVQNEGLENALERRVRELWSKHEHRFVLLSIAIQKRERISRNWLRSMLSFNQDKKVTSILNKLSGQFEDPELMMARTEYIACVEKQKGLETQLAEVRASMAMHGSTGKERLERTSSKLASKIDEQKAYRLKSLQSFQSRMELYGVMLSIEQAEVLLSRIDAGDVTRMSTIFVVISAITRQFEVAKRESGENMDVAKKYYAIYIGLLELQIHIQTEYINRVDSVYLPGVEEIGNEARNLAAETAAIQKTSPIEHRGQYQQNIDSQNFTVEVTEIYGQALHADRDKILRARALVVEQLKLAENTLSTVRVAADLSSLIRQAEGMYKEVMSLQTPALVPFENLQLQREFEAVTVRLRGGN
jgi:hypothetical protein